ncbi:hypothetical protein JD969_17455 [Planctomycetota bacterium]|nr:hypothetical protein JD969_17455 [Planctomycetota bacterium]
MNAAPVINLLKRANASLRWTHLLTITCTASCLSIITAIILIFTDAILALSPIGLIILDIIIAIAIISSIVTLLTAYFRTRFNANRVALIVEDRLNLDNSPLINTLELSTKHCTTGSSTALAELAVEQGNAIATKLSPDRIPDWKPVRKAILTLTSIFILTILTYSFFPSVFNAVLPRLLSPYANHPPFTFVTFNISSQPEKVLHSLPVTISANLSGFITPDTADIVFVDENNQPNQRIEMSPVLHAITTDQTQQQQQAGNTFEFHIESAQQTRNFYIDSPHGRSAIQTLTVLPVPRFEKVYATLDYPDYTNWPEIQSPINAAGITAIAGTQISLTVQSNVPIKAGEIAVEQNIPVPNGKDKTTPNKFTAYFKPHTDDPKLATASFKLLGSGSISATITGESDITCTEPFVTKLTSKIDQFPDVYILDPDERTVVPETYKLDVIIEATDDIGLGTLTLNRSVNAWGSSSTNLKLKTQPSNPTVGEAVYTFDLPKLGAKAGDVIEYHATVYDNHPQNKQFAETPIYIIEVISEEDYLEIARTQYRIDDINEEFDEFMERLNELQEQREAIIEQLDELQSKVESGQQLTEAEQQKLEELEEALKQYEEQTQKLADDLHERANKKQLYDFEEPYNDSLRKLADQLEAQNKAANELKESAAQCKSPSLAANQRQQFTDSANSFRKQKDPFSEQSKKERQYTKDELDKLALADKIAEQGERIQYVIMQQQEVAKRYATLKNKTNLTEAEKQQLRKLGKEEQTLQNELTDATKKLRDIVTDPKHQEMLPNMTGSAEKMCNRIDELKADLDMQQAASKSEETKPREAYDAAQAAADKLESLLSDCQAMNGSACMDSCFKFNRPQMQNALSQMKQGRGVPGTGNGGSDGYGMQGSNAKMSVRGPASSNNGTGEGGDGKHNAGKGKNAKPEFNDVETLDPSEQLDDSNPNDRIHGSSLLRGTPLPYREEAGNYFKRLAEDQAENQQNDSEDSNSNQN